MRSGFVIGVPLTLLQCGVHHHSGIPIDPWTVANNFVMCNAIYDADRLPPDLHSLHPSKILTRMTAVASASFYASNPHTLPLAPLVLSLHANYATGIKPRVAAYKPFFVAALWTVAIYYVPILRHWYDDAEGTTVVAKALADLLTPAALGLSIASLSHAADVVDMDDDEDKRLFTPAVRMGKQEATQYAFALAFASFYLHEQSPTAFALYDQLTIITLVGILFRARTAVLLGLVFVVVYTFDHDLEFVTILLRSTEGSHKMALSACVDLIDAALHLPEPWMRRIAVDLILDAVQLGDGFGRSILQTFDTIVHRHL